MDQRRQMEQKQGITELTWQVHTMYSITPKLVRIRYKRDKY